MVRTMRISLLALGLLGSYTQNTQAITLADAQEVLHVVNKYTPIIALGSVAVLASVSLYEQIHNSKSSCAYHNANDKLNTTRQELIACRTWADQWSMPALKELNVEPEILDNPATWTVYCQNLHIARVHACVRHLSDYQLDPAVLICKLTAEYNQAAQLFATYKTQFHTWQEAGNKLSNKCNIRSYQFDDFSYATVMVPVYLRKIEFLKKLIEIRSEDITRWARTECCSSSGTCTESCSCSCACTA